MDCSSEEMLDLDDVRSDFDLELPSGVREQCTCGASGEDVVSELTSAFHEALQVKYANVGKISDFPVSTNGGSDTTMKMTREKSRMSEHDKTHNDALAPSANRLCKCATFPATGHTSPTPSDSIDEAHGSQLQENASCLHSTSLPVPRKLVSAMKGSREKEGIPLRKLSVSWAPDVYDPPPSSVSHLPKKNYKQHKNNKKHGKGKHKGKNSRGSGKKDKKHHRVGGERAEPALRLQFTMDPVSVAETEKTLSRSYESTVEFLDFDNDIDSPDSNCGSSFLRKSRGTLHLPYTEAT